MSAPRWTGTSTGSSTAPAPRNNLDAMRARAGAATASTSLSASDLAAKSAGFQIARPAGMQRAHSIPNLGGARFGELVNVKTPAPHPVSSLASGSASGAPSSHEHLFTPNANVTVTTYALAPPAGTPVARPSSHTPIPHDSTLDTTSLEKLQAMLHTNEKERVDLLDMHFRLMEGSEDGDLLGQDPQMIAGKLKMIKIRIEHLKAAIASRARSSIASSPVENSIPTPTAPRPISEAAIASRRRAIQESMSIPLHQQPQPEAGPSRRPPSPSSPQYDDIDIADAEEWGSATLVPNSSPEPARSTTRNQPLTDASSAMAEFEDLPPDAFFSPQHSPGRPLRVEASSPVPLAFSPERRNYPMPPSSGNLGGPVPTSTARQPTVAPQRIIKVDKKYPWSKEVQTKLRQVFKLPSFRENQKEAIDCTMAGKDVFVLMPTGGGKSLTYQLPAICSQGKTKGVTFVVSPLISLINDQTRHLIKRNIPSIAYTGDMTQADKNLAHEELSRPDPYTKVVYVTPEMLINGGKIKTIIRSLISRNKLARFVIDEAHCVSAWGHDFRSDYLKLNQLRQEYPQVPIMALTATAPNKVQDDIVRTLGIHNCQVLKQSFNRPNLHYEVRPKLKKVMFDIAAFIKTQEQGASGIIYCSSREKCEVLAKQLREEHGVIAWHYHAGMTKGDRRKVQEGWQDHKFPVIVATIAFGMGIDKPDVRYVIHHSLPRSLEGYYQETGRAGRDGKSSMCILYYTFGDSKTVFTLIDRDQNLDHNQKQRQRDSLNEVLRFCVNKTDCRRRQVLRFFNEDLDPAECHQGCDVCLGRDENRYSSRNVIEDVVKLIKMVQAFASDDRITAVNVVDCFRGMAGRGDKGLNLNPHFGIGKAWARGEAERLVEEVMIDGALAQYYSTNRAGWSNAYIKLGAKARQYLQGYIKTFDMSFREESPRKKATAATKAKTTRKSTTLAGCSAADARRVPAGQQLGRKRSRMEVIEDDGREFAGSDEDDEDYNEDDIEHSDDERPASPLPRAKRARASAAATPAVDPAEQCLEDLKKMRAKHAKKGAVLPDDTLWMIATMRPLNEKALAAIEGITKQQVEEYSSKIFGITIKYAENKPAATTRKPRTSAGSSASASKAATTSKTRTPRAPTTATTAPLSNMSTLFSYAPQLNLTTRNVEPPAARSKSGLTLARPNEAGKSNFF